METCSEDTASCIAAVRKLTGKLPEGIPKVVDDMWRPIAMPDHQASPYSLIPRHPGPRATAPSQIHFQVGATDCSPRPSEIGTTKKCDPNDPFGTINRPGR
jgi:hypothetical protein